VCPWLNSLYTRSRHPCETKQDFAQAKEKAMAKIQGAGVTTNIKLPGRNSATGRNWLAYVIWRRSIGIIKQAMNSGHEKWGRNALYPIGDRSVWIWEVTGINWRRDTFRCPINGTQSFVIPILVTGRNWYLLHEAGFELRPVWIEYEVTVEDEYIGECMGRRKSHCITKELLWNKWNHYP